MNQTLTLTKILIINRGPVSYREVRTASYSSCEKYRWALSIRWDHGDRVAFVGLNPSTATEEADDPTVRKLKHWAMDNSFGSMSMLNAYGFRSTDPKGMRLVDDPVGHANDVFIRKELESCKFAVACWGANCDPDRQRELAGIITKPIYCFAVTKAGFPGHPLYLKTPMELQRWGLR